MSKKQAYKHQLTTFLICKAISKSKNKMLTQESIYKYISKTSECKNNDNFIKTLRNRIQKILRESSEFTKMAKAKNGYLWSIYKNEQIEEPICKPLKHIGKYINLPLIKCKNTYESKKVIYNSLYHTVQNDKIVRRKYNFNINNIYDYNRAIGDHLRMYFSLNNTYHILKVKLTEGLDVNDKFSDLLDDLHIGNDFMSKDVNYEYVNDIINKYCKNYGKDLKVENENVMLKYNMNNSLFEKIDFFDDDDENSTSSKE
ncbi:hypothetical protein BDAP_001430 [Binucleata daphniae]